MRFRFWRGMQGKHFAFFAFLCAATVFVIFVHLEGEIARLDQERSKLENVLARLQVDTNIEHVRRRAPASYQDPTQSLESDELVVIYNRVPKTGSTSFANIAYDLCTRNRFNVLHLNVTKNYHVFSVSDQMRFVTNVTSWEAKKPAFYHGHIAYIEFARFGVVQKPLYINIIREPLDRLISYYYFLRHGDDFRPHLKRRRSGNKETFDECVARDGRDCDPENLWLQVPFFCGHMAECWVPGSQWALEMAKYNLVHNYLVVGLTEDIGGMVAVLEATLPRFFAGATELYNKGNKSHMRKTMNKIPPSDESLAKIKESEIWRVENEFYEFAKEHFQFVKDRTFELRHGYLRERSQQFMYEKIRPR